MRCAMLLLLLTAVASAVAAQVSPAALAPRAVTVTAGVGNAMGWFGAQGEHYIADQRMSLFVGLGYTPTIDQGDPTGLAFGGFTFMGSQGVGYAPAVDPGSQGWAGLLGLAAGYTWRHGPADDGRRMRQH